MFKTEIISLIHRQSSKMFSDFILCNLMTFVLFTRVKKKKKNHIQFCFFSSCLFTLLRMKVKVISFIYFLESDMICTIIYIKKIESDCVNITLHLSTFVSSLKQTKHSSIYLKIFGMHVLSYLING